MKQKKQSKKPSKPVRAWAIKYDGEYRVLLDWSRATLMKVLHGTMDNERIVRVEIREV